MNVTMHFPAVTAAMVAVLALLQAGLMLSVGFSRLEHDQGVGTGGHDDLEQKIRRHGNLAENLPLVALLVGLLEVVTGPSTVLFILAGAFVIARVAHAAALTITTGPHPLRAVGAFGTLLVTVGSAGLLLWSSVGFL